MKTLIFFEMIMSYLIVVFGAYFYILLPGRNEPLFLFFVGLISFGYITYKWISARRNTVSNV